MKLAPSSSSQSGVGSTSNSNEVLNVAVPPSDGGTLRADILRSSSTSTVTASPAEAVQSSWAETANVDVLNGLVKASAVRGIHLVVTVPDNPSGARPGTEIIVAEAHSDATFVK